jgi:hypothetical protein
MLETYRNQSDFKDSWMNDETVDMTIRIVFNRIPHELPSSCFKTPLQFLCTMYDENEVSDWFEPKFALAAVQSACRYVVYFRYGRLHVNILYLP